MLGEALKEKSESAGGVDTGSLDPKRGHAEATPPDMRYRKWRRTLIIVLLVVVAVTLAIVGTAKWRGAESAKRNGVRTATVQRKVFVRSLRIHGVLEAVEYYGVAAPRLSGPGMYSLVITNLAKPGTRVKPGDVLVEFDRQQQLRNALDREAEYRDLLQQIQKKRAEQAAALAGDQTQILQAEHAVQAAALELRKNEVVSRIDAEKNRQNLEEAKATWEQLKQTFQLKRRAAAAEMRILEIQRDRAQEAMRYSQANANRMSVHSPIEGVIVLNSIWKGGQMGEVKEGDEIRSGTPFMQVVNPTTMQVRALANQADVMSLSQGQHARITLDAYPELHLDGTITSIGAEGDTSMSEGVRKFTVLLAVSGADPRLMPDLSAAVDVELASHASVLTVPRDALLQDDGKFSAFLNQGARSRSQAVKIGQQNDIEAVVESGLSEGDVVIRNPQSREASR